MSNVDANTLTRNTGVTVHEAINGEQEHEITDIMLAHSLVIYKTSGLEETNFTICKRLTMLFNRSLTSINIYASSSKFANTMSISTTVDKTLPNNYRSMSLIIYLSEVMEWIIFTTCTQTNNLPKTFRISPRTLNCQLIDIYHHITECFGNNERTCMLIYDMSKPFTSCLVSTTPV